MSNNKLIRCAQIGVDCVANDPVDIRCGGPQYLGFDFNVRIEQANEMKEFICSTLKKFDVPLIDMYVAATIDLSEENVWTEERITQEVKAEAEYLQEEAKRNYGYSFTK